MSVVTCSDDFTNVSFFLFFSESEDNFNNAIVGPSERKTFLGPEAKQIILNVKN